MEQLELTIFLAAHAAWDEHQRANGKSYSKELRKAPWLICFPKKTVEPWHIDEFFPVGSPWLVLGRFPFLEGHTYLISDGNTLRADDHISYQPANSFSNL
jgi:hypothetical protein